MKKLFLCLFATLLLTTAAFAKAPIQSGNVSQLNIGKHIDLTIVQAKQYSLKAPEQVHAVIYGHVLSLSVKQGFFASLFSSKKHYSVQVTLPQLTGLTVNGDSNVAGNALVSKRLFVQDHSSGQVTLAGKLDVIGVQGSTGQLAIHGILTKQLLVKATGTSQITLSGIATRFTAVSLDQAQINAQGLQTTHTTVHASGSSTVRVDSLKNLTAHRTGSAKIISGKVKVLLNVAAGSKSLPNFSRVQVQGGVNLQLYASKKPRLIIREASQSQAQVLTRVAHGTLYIINNSFNQASPTVRLGVTDLHGLSLQDNATATGKNLQFTKFSIAASGHSRINLSGRFQLNNLQLSQFASANLSWIDSFALHAQLTDHAQATLSGVVKSLWLKAAGNSQFKSRYLRAGDVDAQATNHAVIRVLPIKSLRAFAYGNSEILYYRDTKEVAALTQTTGNVLQVRWQK